MVLTLSVLGANPIPLRLLLLPGAASSGRRNLQIQEAVTSPAPIVRSRDGFSDV